jgi:hypothetical protein
LNSLAHWLGESREETPPPGGLLSDHLQHLSASSIGMLYRCPRQFRHRYLLHEKERPGESIVIGSFFHETLNWNYNQKVLSHVDQPLSDAVQYLQDVAVPKVLEKEGGEDVVAWDPGSSLDNARGDADRILGAYYHSVVPRIQPVQTEQKFEIKVEGVEVPVIGYIDVEDERRVLDTKTGKQVAKKIKPSWWLQGRLYSFAAQKPTEFHSISRAKTPSICTALESDQMTVPLPDASQVAHTSKLVNQAADLIRYFLSVHGVDEEWPTWGAIPDFSRTLFPCDFCGWRKGCPAWS